MYADINNKALFIKAMEYSNEYLPFTEILSNQNSSLYREIIKRYESYESFAKDNNTLTRMQRTKLGLINNIKNKHKI